MSKSGGPTQEQAGALVGMAAVLFGGWVRLLIPQLAGFPVNDGGLFYLMIKAVQANGLRIPASVHYNGMDVPFAYPPLGFLVGAAISDVFRADVIRILQWLPAAVLVCTLPAMYFLAKAVLGSSWTAGLATLMFAFTPRAITWQIMGGGLTRSFGQLFLLLSAACIYRVFTGYSRKWLWLSILSSSLVVLSHPEAALQAVGIAILFWLFRGLSKQGTVHAAMIGGGTLLCTAIWWLPLVVRLGIGTLLSAGETGQYGVYALLEPFLLNFVDEPLMTLVAVFAVIGFAAQAARRQWLVPVWLFLPFALEPRSAANASMIPLAILAGIALSDILLPALARLEARGSDLPNPSPLAGHVAPIFLLFVGAYMLGSTAYFGSQLAASRLAQTDLQAFDWVKANTPETSSFLVLTGNTSAELFCDAPAEWFPALTQRTSITTIQGREWQQGEEFDTRATGARALSACLSAQSPEACLQARGNGLAGGFDYLYVERKPPELNHCRVTGETLRGERMLEQLKGSTGYSMVYESEGVTIFKKAH